MGTNYYLSDPPCHACGRSNEGSHIGKRSAAGFYCWDCGVTLCELGESGVHQGASQWANACPKCGAEPASEPKFGAAGVELGFREANSERPSGVASCSSFSWAMPPEVARAKLESSETVVRDEYGRTMTGERFLRMLDAQCPIRFTGSVGRHFS